MPSPTRAERALAYIDALRDTLLWSVEYVDHLYTCETWCGAGCSCGLHELLARVEVLKTNEYGGGFAQSGAPAERANPLVEGECAPPPCRVSGIPLSLLIQGTERSE